MKDRKLLRQTVEEVKKVESSIDLLGAIRLIVEEEEERSCSKTQQEGGGRRPPTWWWEQREENLQMRWRNQPNHHLDTVAATTVSGLPFVQPFHKNTKTALEETMACVTL